jgi:hypothetical protein
VKLRIAVSARAIIPEGEGFTATLPTHDAVAQLTDEGLVLGEPDAEQPLQLRFSSWGAVDAEREVEPVAPALGDCVTEVLPEGDCARRLEYAHEGVTAWWVGLDGGVAFGWTVAALPADGDDTLTVRTEVDGADWMAAAGEGVELVDAAGVTWTVSGALAWGGADGTPLPTWLEVEGDALVVRVDAEGAVYPVTVDPVLSAATTTLMGAAAYDSFGAAVSGAGDVNGDGYDDVIVGAFGCDLATDMNVGAVFVHQGYADEDGDGVPRRRGHRPHGERPRRRPRGCEPGRHRRPRRWRRPELRRPRRRRPRGASCEGRVLHDPRGPGDVAGRAAGPAGPRLRRAARLKARAWLGRAAL